MGEVRSNTYIDLQNVARETINKVGYTKAEYQFDGDSFGILAAIHEQNDDINRGVSNKDTDEQGAGKKKTLETFFYIFNPILANNQIYTQRYFNEIKMFVEMTKMKNGTAEEDTDFMTLRSTYAILEELNNIR